jgi:hypothetical protein
VLSLLYISQVMNLIKDMCNIILKDAF